MSTRRATAGSRPGETGDAFSLFGNEEAVLGRTEVMLARLGEVGDGVRDLAGAYRRSYHEQRRLVRLSDRMQLDLQRANQRMAEQQRELQLLNTALSGEIELRAHFESELRRLADTDHLTGTLSRRRFLETCERVSARGRSTEAACSADPPCCVLMLDLDRFKRVNDTYGHGAGDAVLQSFAETCREALRSEDAIGRLGGEEFAILLTDSRLSRALAVAERLRRSVSGRPVVLDEGTLSISVSIGLAAFRRGEPLADTLRRADAALYAAKHAGRDCVRCADADGEAPDPFPSEAP